jgi:tripartite-type tricarboxylate transporter receptor subunit TctC
MKLPRRNFLHLAAGAAALPAVSRFARAQAYPSRPVRLIVPFGSAGAMDITARLIGQWLSERLGQQFVIENRTGAGGNVGTEAVVRAAPDGYTLGLFGAANAINATLYDKLNFNFVRDIAPVAPIVRFPYIMVLNTSRRQAEATSPNDTSRTSGHVRLESAQWAKRTLIPVIDRAATAVCS